MENAALITSKTLIIFRECLRKAVTIEMDIGSRVNFQINNKP